MMSAVCAVTSAYRPKAGTMLFAREGLLLAMSGHIIAKVKTVGLYQSV